MKKTSFLVTSSLYLLEEKVIKAMDIPRTTYQRRAVLDFLKGDRIINERLLIVSRSHPDYVKKDYLEQIYIDEEIYNQLKEVAQENINDKGKPIHVTTVLFQAMLDYTSKMAFVYLGEGE